MTAEGPIRIRACLAVIEDEKILLVPHYDTDAGPIQWNLPGGKVEFGESVRGCALREFKEETGFDAEIGGVIDITEVIKPEESWHSVTITFRGTIIGGAISSEEHPRFGKKSPTWFSASDLGKVPYHPKRVVDKILPSS